MRTVGIREMKNRLSEYLRRVRGGETILVTDRGRVIAQLGPPPPHAAPTLSEDEALARLAAAGKVRPPRSHVPSPGEGPIPALPPRVDAAEALGRVRADRDEP